MPRMGMTATLRTRFVRAWIPRREARSRLQTFLARVAIASRAPPNVRRRALVMVIKPAHRPGAFGERDARFGQCLTSVASRQLLAVSTEVPELRGAERCRRGSWRAPRPGRGRGRRRRGGGGCPSGCFFGARAGGRAPRG